MNQAPTQILATGLSFPEGPVALSDGSLLVVEVLGGRLSRIAPDGSRTIVAETGGGPNGAAIGPDGRCWICNNGGFGPSESNDVLIPGEPSLATAPGRIEAVDLASGSVETVYAHTDETPFWSPNDIVFDAEGGFWFTDYGRDRGRLRTRGSVYYAKAGAPGVSEILHPMESPNGIGLSPDGSTLYVAETFTGHLWAFQLSEPGVIDRQRGTFPNGGTIIGRSGAGQFLDSLAVDSEGNICCASPGLGNIIVFGPDGGVVREIATPDFLTTNLAFGGPDLATAYVTLSSSGRVMTLDWPCPGLPLAWT